MMSWKTQLCFVALIISAAAMAGFGRDTLINAVSSDAAQTGESVAGNIKLYRVDDVNWKEFSQNVDMKGTDNRLRFRVTRPVPPELIWQIFIKDQNNGITIWAYTAQSDEELIWTSTLYSKRVRVTVVTNVEQNSLKILIDRLSYVSAPSIPQSLVGTPFTPITTHPQHIRAAGGAVAKLRIEEDGVNPAKPRFCTGFLISADLLITNRHCVTTGTEAGNLEAQFGIDTPGAKPSATSRVKELVLASCDLDFVILRLRERMCSSVACDGPTDYRPLGLKATPEPLMSTSKLAVIQYPGSFAPKAVAYKCDIGNLSRIGNSTTRTDFGHKCDAEKGSSGSPVLILRDDGSIGSVVGLHHWGTRIDLPIPSPLIKENLAVNIIEIISYIKKNSPSLAAELGIQ